MPFIIISFGVGYFFVPIANQFLNYFSKNNNESKQIVKLKSVEYIPLQIKKLTKSDPSLEDIEYLIKTWLSNKSNYLAGKGENNLSEIVKDNLIKRTIEEREADIKKEIYKEIKADIQRIELVSQTLSRIVVLVQLNYSEKIIRNSGELISDTFLQPLNVKYILGFKDGE